MCWTTMSRRPGIAADVSVAGCLGYDVLVIFSREIFQTRLVSVAGCLGYDVLEFKTTQRQPS